MSELTDTIPPSNQISNTEEMLLVAGPCSAESREQLLSTALELQPLSVSYFRAGLWKPRTRPGSFEGVGEKGLPWLLEVREKTGLRVMTEVSLPDHVEAVQRAGLDALWVGARTVSDPFAVQNLADALSGSSLPLFIKNPISPDLDLWIGAIERFMRAGITTIGAIFRGFSPCYSSKLGYRNTPSWSIAFELKRLFPKLPIICDPSHITGRRRDIEEFCTMAVELGFDGIMVETHIHPEDAKSDANQQVTPFELKEILGKMELLKRNATGLVPTEMEAYRKLLSEIDDTLLSVLARRMEVSHEIGLYKQSHQIPILQMEYFSEVLAKNLRRAEALNLPQDFVYHLYTDIHELSTKIQFESSGIIDPKKSKS